MQLVTQAKEAAKDRQSAFSQYIILVYRSTGRLAPGCDAKDFFAAYDTLIDKTKPTP
jgi:hypothetical protein